MIDRSRAAHRRYIKDELKQSQNDSGQFWRNIKKLIPNLSHSDFIQLKNEVTGKNLEPDEIPNYINSFFANIGPKLSQNMYAPWRPYDERCEFELNPIRTTVNEVSTLIKGINVNKSSGMDCISNQVVKDAFTCLVPKVTDMFNSSFITNTVPDKWKIATIVPIYKAGDSRSVGNYRPVALTPTPCKMIEKLMHKHIFNFIDHHKILTTKQGGFRPGHSTLSTLASFTDEIARNLNVAKPTVAAFIDLSKAFDTVDHLVLLDKLENYGIRNANLKWIKSYLSNRMQRTKVNGLLSDLEIVICGVPQGSILGPLMFLLYVNDLPKCVTDSSIMLYADDTVIYNADPKCEDSQSKLQLSLDKFALWSIQNKLTVNSKKTKLMCFTASKRKLNSMDVSLTLNDVKLMIVPSYKYLGVTLDSHLKYDLHIKHMLQTISHKTYMLACIRSFMTESIALKIFKAMVLPYFDYGDILFLSANKDLLNDLQIAQNRCLKICLKLPWLTNTDLVHKKAKITKLGPRRIYHMNNFMYKRSRDPLYQDVKDLPTRKFLGPVVNRFKSNGNLYFKSIEHLGAMLWNDLKPEYRLLPTIKRFKIEGKVWLKTQIPIA